ncbi:MAG: hypothetical protein WC501_04600 [Candidatus Micrarchaeia archaeon]
MTTLSSPFIKISLTFSNTAEYVHSIPLEKRAEERDLKKGLLREASKLLGIPESIIKRKKKAA